MSKKIENLRDLFIEQGRELYDASMLVQEELPKIQKKVSNPKLNSIIERELLTARRENDRIEAVFETLKESPFGERNECCAAVLEHSKKMIKRSTDPRVRDAAIINSIQRLNHNKITGFGSMTAYAREIGQESYANALHETLLIEKALDKELSMLAETEINHKAAILYA
jgi:ferritin-like metal-binding protein YciE